MPRACEDPRSASLVTVAGLMSTLTSGTDAGRMFPVAIECSIVATMIAKPTSGSWSRMAAGAGKGSAKSPAVELDVGGRTVRVSNPERVYFPATVTKLADRGSAQAMGIITDIGLFLEQLARELAPED